MGGTQSSIDPMTVVVPDLDKLLERDGYLKSYEREFRRRFVQVMFLFFFTITLPFQCHVEGHIWAMAVLCLRSKHDGLIIMNVSK